MADIGLPWEVPDIMEPEESVSGMLKVLEGRSFRDTGTFWTWEGKVGARSVAFSYHKTYSLQQHPW